MFLVLEKKSITAYSYCPQCICVILLFFLSLFSSFSSFSYCPFISLTFLLCLFISLFLHLHLGLHSIIFNIQWIIMNNNPARTSRKLMWVAISQ